VQQFDDPAADCGPRSVRAGFHRLAVQIDVEARKIAFGHGECSAKAQALVIDAKLLLQLLLHLVQLAIAFLRGWKCGMTFANWVTTAEWSSRSTPAVSNRFAPL
jgi:hypothetical protein